MPRFVTTEIQHVIACRAVEADTRDAALEMFMNGEGVEYGRDGEVIDSTLSSVEEG